MAIHVRKPSSEHLAALLERAASDELTYSPPGASLTALTPPGLKRHEWSTTLRPGSFGAASRAVTAWEVHRRSGLEVHANDSVSTGINVAMAARLPAGYIDITCRVVAVVEEPRRAGFAYGTLSVHPERGEESFVVTEHDDGSVTFTVVAVSAPVHPLARLAGPIADRLQDRAVRRYLAAMAAIVSAP